MDHTKPAQWFRMYAEFATDPKVQMLSEADQRRYMMLLCLRCSNGDARISDLMFAEACQIGITAAKATKARLIENVLIYGQFELVRKLVVGKDSDRPLAHIWKSIRERIFARDNYTCQYCGEHGKRLECDHVIPVARGGSHDEENLVTACFKCNRSKRDKLVSEWRAS